MTNDSKAKRSGQNDCGSSACYLQIPLNIVDEDQLAIDQARKDFPSLFERSIQFNIPAKIITESTPSSYGDARIAERLWLGR